MANPDLQTFHGLAEQGNLVPVWKLLTADLETPVSAYLKLAEGAEYAFVLGSALDATPTSARHPT